jgi:hypothetical protein
MTDALKITAFAPANLSPLRVEMEAALKAVAERHGIAFTLGKMTYEPGGASFRATVEAKVPELADAANRQELEMWCGIHNLDPDKMVKTNKGEEVRLTGYNARGRSKPWIVSVNGVPGFKAGDAWVRASFKSDTPRPALIEEPAPARTGA